MPAVRVALFPTCLVDLYFPAVGEATVRLLRRCGCRVDYPPGQACCGQPAWNAGHPAEARRMAAALVRALSGADYVVTPSGSCAGMVRAQYPALFAGDPGGAAGGASAATSAGGASAAAAAPATSALAAAARALAARTYELSEFLVRVLGVDLRALGARWSGTVAYHASCHMTRELGVWEEPLTLLRQVEGLELRPLERPDLCCGFGGTFSVKLPEVAVAMADDKLDDVRQTGADCLVSADAGCLMHLAGRIRRSTGAPRVMHLAELLEAATRPAAGNAGGAGARPHGEGSPWH